MKAEVATESLAPSVAGRITIAGTDRGVAGLVVEAHDVGTETATRLGSASTSSQGTFSLDLPVPTPDRGSWDLLLAVVAPERDNGEGLAWLFRSEVRRRAGLREQFQIELDPERLKAAGIAVVASESEQATATASAILATEARTRLIREANDRIVATKLESVSERRTLYRAKLLKPLRRALSNVSDEERASGRFVSGDDQIDSVARATITENVSDLIAKEQDPSDGTQVSRVRLKGRVLLSAAEQRALLGRRPTPTTLTEAEVESRLGVSVDRPPSVYRLHVEPDPCRPDTGAEHCLNGASDAHEHDAQLEETSPAGEGSRGASRNGHRGGRNVTFKKGAAIAHIFERQAAPEDPVEFGTEDGALETPLTSDGVSNAIEELSLEPGPADVPAFYDFHDLQIAFEPVWQEALDDRYLADVEEVYDRIVEGAGAPALVPITNFLNGNPPRNFVLGLLDVFGDIGRATESSVPTSVASAVLISLEEWRALPSDSRAHLLELANEIRRRRELIIEALKPSEIELPALADAFGFADLIRAANTEKTIAYRAQIDILTADAERLVAHARRLILEREANEPFKPSHEIIDRLRRARSGAYPFRYFAASPTHRSVNFGLLVTYRQKWVPVTYQVGELVSTIALAPKEIRRFSRRTVIKTRRAQQEIESNLVSRRGESEERSRAEAEIVARATAKTNFSLSNSGTMSFGEEGIGGSATTTTTFTRDAEQHSQSVKKEFREAILKSAEEYKNERKVELTTEESYESEVTESGEIQNPNDEIPVTFLFYELQRRFRVSEKLHRLQSVVFVAQEMPSPTSIDAAWLIRHDWILNRVLLDDSFRPALTYASTTLISEDAVLREMRQALFRQRTLVEELKEDVADRRALAGLRYAALQRQIERTAESAGGGGGGLFGTIGDIAGGIPLVGEAVESGIELITGGGGPTEEAQLREGAARDAFERERREEEELAARLLNAISTLEAMQRAYSERLGQHLRELAQVERLIGHIVQNVMHYMQAIWAHEPDDQRFLRLRNVPVPVFEKDKGLREWFINPAATLAPDRPLVLARSFEVTFDLGLDAPPARPQEIETMPLSEVADLARPLGFLGNYLIFPMIEANPITEFMMDPYVTLAEGEFGVSDPDPLGNMTLDEFSDYVCCLKAYFEAEQETETDGGGDDVGDSTPDRFEELKPFLRDALNDLLQRTLRNDEEVIVPSNSLYIEALPGAHSVMEKFKHLHRQIDVKTAQENLRRIATDNVRRAQRVLDGDLEDPEIEAKYVFEGDPSPVVAPAPPGGGNP
jgi:hypothetical protein